MSWLAFAVLTLALAASIALAYRRRWRWTGFAEARRNKADDEDVQPAKTLWDWLQLLVVPLALAGLAFLLNNSQSERELQREDQRASRERAAAVDAAREEAVRGYLTQMSGLMLDRELLRSQLLGRGSDVRAVARTVTLTTLRRLDSERKGVVIRFLAESHLIDATDFNYKVDLMGANLRRADLRLAPLRGTWLRGVDFQDADLRRAFLAEAHLVYADLRGADLRRADLRGADLEAADLRGADLRGPDLHAGRDRLPRLEGANLSQATKYDSTTRWPDGFDPAAAGGRKSP